MNQIEDYVTENMKEQLRQLADLADDASCQVYDDDQEDGTGGILKICDKLVQKIDAYLNQ